MSLLMDALKKAEQEKKAASERLQKAVEEDNTASLSQKVQGSELELAPESDSVADQGSQAGVLAEYAHSKAAHVTFKTDLTSDKQAMSDKEILHSSGNEYFFEETSAVQLAQDIGKGAPTPVTAQTVFMAGATRYSVRQVLLWSSVCVLFLSMVGVLGVLGYFYMSPDEFMQPPIVVTAIEHHSETAVDSVGQPSFNTSKDTDPMAEAEVFSDEAMTDMSKENAISHDVYIPKESLVSLDDSVLEQEIEQEIEWEIEQEPIKISRSNVVDKHRALIDLAYAQYLDADYVVAAENYNKVLHELPHNRDALLGLAVINELLGDTSLAYAYYLRALKYYPQNGVVEAALINLQGKGDPIKKENILRALLKQQPDNSFLYYSLGELYAKQQRWSEAQRAFFNAYSKESASPDYAYNLAVSLDHIQQYNAAITYYKVSLENAKYAPFIFDKEQVASRVATLSRLAVAR